jgi:hypothetical protein
MQLDLNDEETLALLNLLVDAIEADRYPLCKRRSKDPSLKRRADR